MAGLDQFVGHVIEDIEVEEGYWDEPMDFFFLPRWKSNVSSQFGGLLICIWSADVRLTNNSYTTKSRVVFIHMKCW